MLKNMLKRSWLSIIRKPGRAVLIGLILFAMANLVLASLAIKGSVTESVEYAKSSLGGSVYLQADITKLREQMQSEGGGEFTPGQRPQIERPDIPFTMVNSMADSEYVKDYTYGLSAQAKADGFTPIELETESPFGGGFSGFGGGTEAETQLEGDITISGINSYAFISGVENETMKLTSGEHFDETTDDQVIISYDLATSNDLEVGDKVALQNVYDSGVHEVTIIGIYDLTEEEQGFAFVSPENTIYMNVATAAKFLSSEDYNDGDFAVQNVRFELTNAEHSEAFISEATSKFPSLEADNLALSINTAAYEQMVGPIESVGDFATTILWIVIIASIAIITLIITINVKDRQYEMGVLLSLGASKLNVTGQILTELVAIGTVALIASVGTGTLVAQTMSQGLLEGQLAMSEQESENNFGRPSAFGGGGRQGGPMGGGASFMGGSQQQSDAEAIDSIDVNAAASDYLLLFAVGYGVMILALALPTWNIVKYQPKTILTGKE